MSQVRKETVKVTWESWDSAGTGRYHAPYLSQLLLTSPHFSLMQDDWAVGLQQSPRVLKSCDASCIMCSFLCHVQKEIYLGCLDTHSAHNRKSIVFTFLLKTFLTGICCFAAAHTCGLSLDDLDMLRLTFHFPEG